MNKDEFVKQVQEQTGLPSKEAAEEGSQIVLSLLSHRLTPEEACNAGAQLESELRRMWNSDTWINNYLSISGQHQQLRFRKKEEMFSLIQNEIEKRDLPVGAQQLATSVFHVLKEQISEGEIEDIADQLPDDIEQFWNAA